MRESVLRPARSHLAPLAAGLSHMAFWKVTKVHGLHGSRRPLSRAPHHEGLEFRREKGLILRSPPQGGRLEGWPQKNCALGSLVSAPQAGRGSARPSPRQLDLISSRLAWER